MCYKTGQLRRILSILLLHRVALYCSEGRATAASHIHHTSQPWRKTPLPHGRCRKWTRKLGLSTTIPINRTLSGVLTLIGRWVISQVTWLEEKNMAAQMHNTNLTGWLTKLNILADIMALYCFVWVYFNV